MSCFEGGCAVVTGAASGLGLGISEKFLECGGKAVYMADCNKELLQAEAGKLSVTYPGQVFQLQVDVTDRTQIHGLISKAAKEAGSIDFLFNNAGRPMTRPTAKTSVEEFESLVQLNFLGTVYGTLAALEIMSRQGHGHIINTASFGGLIPVPCQTAYCATKSAVITMTRCLAYEYAGSGIHFSQFSPSNVATPIFAAEQSERMRREGRSEEEIRKAAEAVKPPENAMPLHAALEILFQGIEQKKTDIICGQDAENIYRIFCTDRTLFDEEAVKLGVKRSTYYKELYRAMENGETLPAFPG